jgi:NAD-dependent deacetylase sirtuin 4
MSDLSAAVAALRGRRLVVLTGAGCSTESGIPDYRGAGRPPRRSIQHAEMVADPHVRQRYWLRAYVGWPRIAAAAPNAAHRALGQLDATALVTQNVDGLHLAVERLAPVVELHGTLRRARCLACAAVEDRAALQERLASQVGPWTAWAEAAPDGDADLDEAAWAGFVAPTCLACGGPLVPDVVLFGGSVPRPVTDAASAAVDQADGMLIVGTSLTVWSARRLVGRALDRGLPVVVVNEGPTRLDDRLPLRLAARAGEALPGLVEGLRA